MAELQKSDFSADNSKAGFEGRALTADERDRLGISSYMRPYRVDPRHIKTHHIYRTAKRATDIVCSLLAIIVLSPLLLITALLIVIDDPKGGPLFRQKRVGREGKEFNFYKFRSMCVNAEAMLPELAKKNEVDGKAFKIKDDPRITRVGRVLRSFSIDELPQLFNILKGDISIVGPRPPLPREVALYDDYEKQRLLTTPGLTCVWQVYPHRHEISFDDWVAMDLKYIAERSYLMDWKLIFQTVGRVAGGHSD